MAGKIKAALLVDADNLPTSQAEEALEKLAEICNPVIKKAFGDFTKSAKNWSPEFMRKRGFTPEMHFAVSNFKNGADIAMCIAAMDIVYAKSVEAIVLFTSDSDFASLAARIREAGLEVVGVGDAKASEVLRGAFDTFIVIQAVKPAAKPTAPKPPKKKKAAATPKPIKSPQKPAATNKSSIKAPLKTGVVSKVKPENTQSPPSKAVPLIIAAMKNLVSQDGSFRLGNLGAKLVSEVPGFTAKNYGCANLSELLEKTGQFNVIRSAGQIDVTRKNQSGAKAK